MIPHKLTLRNFMCYRDEAPPLHFDGLNVVCLSGENGAGKSALLDAMTWALWGEARGKSDDDLIALGQDEMEVDFEFVLDGVLRRVVRRRTRGKRGQTLVDFQVCDDQGAWRRISGDGVRDTNGQIAEALRMGYDTFINSAFLLQGRADEFTNRKPAERKQVLVDILGLDEYTRLEERAKARRGKCDEELRGLEGIIADHEAQVARRPFLLQELERVTALAGKLDAEVAGAEERAQGLRKEVDRLREVADKHAEVDLQLGRHAAELHKLQQEIAATELRVEQAERTVARRTEIEAGVTALEQARARWTELVRLREEAFSLNEIKKEHEAVLTQLRLQLENEQRRLTDQLATLRTRVAGREALETELVALDAEMAAYTQLHAEMDRSRMEQAELEQRRNEINDLRLQHQDLKQPLDRMRTSLLADQSHLQQSIQSLEASVARAGDFERELEVVRAQLRVFEEVEARITTAREALRGQENERASLREQCATYEKQGKEINKKLELLAAGEGVCPVCDQNLGQAGQTRLEAQYSAERDALRREFTQAKRAAGELDKTIQKSEAELRGLEQQLAGRTGVDGRRATLEANLERAQADARALHEQQMTLEVIDRQLATEDYGHAERAKLTAVEAALQSLGDFQMVQRELEQVRRTLQAAERRLRDEAKLHQQLAKAQERLNQVIDAEAQLPPLQAELVETTRRLDQEDYGHADRAARDELLARMHALGYTRVAYDAVKAEIETLEHWSQDMVNLQLAEGSLARDRSTLVHNRELAARIGADLEREREQLAALDLQLRSRQMIELDLADAEKQLGGARTRQGMAHREFGSAERALILCDEVAALLAGYQAQEAATRDQRAIYDELAQAFGKKGIQAMLIDAAIPELEREANELLGRMTDNQMHLSFETQRDSKKGDTLETLDIRIADGLGTRDYSMFSGGEAFRVNFAVRVALSKLLAHRADANLKTLVIDEGFGTQDGRGRDRIVEAINAVSTDFERILVITHIQELKDLFPTQIEVTKGPSGSTWALVS
jgi:exonuclease SbcC